MQIIYYLRSFNMVGLPKIQQEKLNILIMIMPMQTKN